MSIRISREKIKDTELYDELNTAFGHALSKDLANTKIANLTSLSATGLTIASDPPTQAEAEAIISALDATRVVQASIITALKELNTNIGAS